MRQIVLDTETTGLDISQGHRIIEIGAVEMVDRKITGNNFHIYINPEREVDEGALSVHGISNEFLDDKPIFKHVYNDFIDYLNGDELIIHNAAFDVGFINYEFQLLGNVGICEVDNYCSIIDTLKLARDLFPGQRNSLDALCKRYGIENSHRTLHGALLDSEILADVYLMLTGGQLALIDDGQAASEDDYKDFTALANQKIIKVNLEDKDLDAHDDYLRMIQSKCELGSLWVLSDK